MKSWAYRKEYVMQHIISQKLMILLILCIALISYSTGYVSQKDIYKSTEQSKYILKEPTRKKVIVFVHGVTGDSISTWTNNKTKAYWPKLISQDEDFSEANVYVFQYPSPKFRMGLSITELAEKMRLRLKSDKVLDHQKLIFISHSMGGLVTRGFLLNYREIAKKVGFAYFFATPTEGSQYAKFLSSVSKNRQFENLYPLKPSNFLADLQHRWLSANFKFGSHCAYEGRKTSGLIIVDQRSASNLCTKHLDPMLENHIDIVKPKNMNSDIYIAFKNAYMSFIKTKKGENGEPPTKILLRLAKELTQEFSRATEIKKPPLNESNFRRVREKIMILKSLDFRNGHVYYYLGEMKRWMGKITESQGHFYKYLETEPHRSISMEEDDMTAIVCLGSAAGYCRQRSGWISHLLAIDFYNKGLGESNLEQARDYFEDAIKYAQKAQIYYPGGFKQEPNTKKIERDSRKKIKSIDTRRGG